MLFYSGFCGCYSCGVYCFIPVKNSNNQAYSIPVISIHPLFRGMRQGSAFLNAFLS